MKRAPFMEKWCGRRKRPAAWDGTIERLGSNMGDMHMAVRRWRKSTSACGGARQS